MSAASAILEPKMAASGQRCEDGVPDMTAISDIDVEGVNTNLRVRFERNEIYTFTGTILVVRISKKNALNFNSIWFSVFRFPTRAPHPMHHSFHCAIMVVLSEPKNVAAPADLLLTIVQMTLTFKQTNDVYVQATNPYEFLPIYEKDMMMMYNGRKMGALPPHVFATAEASRGMVHATPKTRRFHLSKNLSSTPAY